MNVQDCAEPAIDFTSMAYGQILPLPEAPSARPPAAPVAVPPPQRATRPSLPRTTPPTPKLPYLLAHWRGELPLVKAYWINVFALGCGLIVAEKMLLAGLHAMRVSLTTMLVISIVYAVVRLCVAAWQIVGTLRSAFMTGGGWAVLVNILMVISFFGWISTTLNTVRTINALADAATEQRSMNDYTVSVTPDGKSLLAKGSMGYGFARAVSTAFAAHPNLRKLTIDSRGGDVEDGQELHDYLASRPDITIEVNHLCASACTWAFIGAHERLISPEAVMGFHQMRSMIDTDYSRTHLQGTQDHFKEQLRELGASESFISQAFARQGNDVWVPDSHTLFANHIITGVDEDGHIIGEQAWRGERMLNLYRKRPDTRNFALALERLRTQQPALFDEWATHSVDIARLPQAMHANANNTNLWTTLHRGARVAWTRVPDSDLRLYTASLRDRLIMLRDHESAVACGKYGSGISIDLPHTQKAYNLAIGESYAQLFTGSLGDPPSAEQYVKGAEQLARERKSIAIDTTATGDQHYVQVCTMDITLLNRLLASPAPGSALAMRSLFQH
ncbi:hypothetical protein [Dyella sp.]|uniref:hypothetical protein n=1 Tax=Dyella sp. TaxID=1869338 RepID=UPI002ECFCF06